MKLSRKALILVSALGLIVSVAMWVGVKIGRPIYYSDGHVGMVATSLRESGMLRWSVPQIEMEIPGPVRGRVTVLPDGRWIYGLARGPSVTDLVVFDPNHPSDPVQPVIELNSKGHDLAPVLGPGGQLLFASDRPGGPGGFDLYSATYRNGLFYAPRPLPEGINTGLDESDPTVDRGGGQIVFVRRDPDVESGRNGKLMTVSLAAPEAAEPVFSEKKETKYRRELPPPIDRDPVLAPDGVALYFVRQVAGEALALMRTSWHIDHYVKPMAVGALQTGGPYRGPALIEDGFGMRLVTGENPARVVRSEAREVYPFWEGQWWLEWLLLYLALFFGVILTLLSLGARWSQLDVITKLVLLSLLIHLLLLLWLSGVEIIHSFNPRGPDTGAVQVHLISQRASSGDSTATAPSQNQIDVSRALSFEGHEQSLQPTGPEVAVEASQRELESVEAEARPTLRPVERRQDAKLADQARAVALRAGVAQDADPDRRRIQTAAETANKTEANRRDVASEKIEVVVPGSESNLTARRQGGPATEVAPATARAIPRPRDRRQTAEVADRAAQPTRRANPAEAAGAADQLRANVGRRVAVAMAQPTAVRSEGGELSVPKVVPKQNLLAGAAPIRRVEQPAAVMAAPEPRKMTARVEDVADDPKINTRPRRAAASEARLARSERVAGRGLSQAQKDVAVSRELRSARQSSAAAPRSDLLSESRRIAPGKANANRALPRPSHAVTNSDVALADEVQDPAKTHAAGGTKSAETRIAATDLKRLNQPRSNSAETNLVRGDPTGVMTDPIERLTPGSLMARDSRRVAAAADFATRTTPRETAAMLAGAIALRDGADSEPTSPSAGPIVERPEVTTRSSLARMRQQDLGESERPRRDDYAGGTSDVSIGIVPPGSFLDRAGVRSEIPVIAARTEKLTPYSNRFGANKVEALKKYGGTKETERAVARGLAYLASIQNDNGSWGSPRRSQKKYGDVFIGKSGLCLLAFLGAGHTPDSKTKYSGVTRRAVNALLRTQRQSAHFGATTAYSHGIVTYALAECFALTKDETLRDPIERAVKWILANQLRGRDRRNRGGWGYFSSTLRPEDNYARSSTTAWQVMALESAKLSGIEVPDDALAMARAYLLQNYDRRYRYFLYNREPDRLRSEWRTLPASTPAAVFCLLLFGMEPTEERLAAGLEYTLDRRPRRYRRYSDDDFVLRGAGNVYFWYYSTLACFMAGGDTWDRWNSALKKVLLSGQAADGSFPIIDTYAGYAGDTNRDRSYTTAMCVLSLEVYYRYFTPLLKKDN